MADQFTKEDLERMYHKEMKSIPEIAENFSTYANKIRRAMLKYGIPIRSSSESQALALKSGRLAHPTAGTTRPDDVKFAIGSKQMENFKQMTDEEKTALSDRAKIAWDNKSEQEIREMREKASKGFQKAGREGSKIEKYLYKALQDAGYHVQYHMKHFLSKQALELDLYVPVARMAIECQGPSHYEAIFDEQTFQRVQIADKVKQGQILNAGLCMVLVPALNKSPTYFKKVADALIEKIEAFKQNFPERENRYIILNVE